MANWYDTQLVDLKWAVGLYVPNRNFRDYHADEAGDSITLADGEVAMKTGFDRWTWRSAASGDTVGPLVLGAAGYTAGDGWDDGAAVLISTSDTSNSISMSTGVHNVYDTTLMSDFIPLSLFLPDAYKRYLKMSCVAKSSTSIPAADIVYVLGYYSETYAYLGHIATATAQPASVWTKLDISFTNPGTISSSAKYVMLHIGVKSGAGTTESVAFDEISLFTDPLSGATSSTYRTLTGIYFRGVPRISSQSEGMTDSRMLDGHLVRRQPYPGMPKSAFSLEWYREDGSILNELRKMFMVSTVGWAGTIAEPCPLVVETGLGVGSYWGYYHVASATFNGTFNDRHYDSGFDVGLSFIEV